MGNARHRNLVRLLGYCSNKKVVYLLYDCLANGNLGEKMEMKKDHAISTWAAKYKDVIGIAGGSVSFTMSAIPLSHIEI
ncbi:hypothetical protein AAC387_Pa01g2727 [Persea americana]